ncbi:unnamed protein product [Prorocentrum cordatum]|uniref:Uncharacterized protein n=1 Tax=Prorocentrum cordatum TaxID=2364126 RepID=A0ABN9QBI9_9DINO|nr:unnamed protein product [Polarella glacialis]
MNGPTPTSKQCFLSEPCHIAASGVGLGQFSAVLIVAESDSCGEAGATVISWSGIDNPSATLGALTYYDAGMGSSGSPGSHKVCWGASPGGLGSEAYNVLIGDVHDEWPLPGRVPHLHAGGQPCNLEIGGVGLSGTNSLQLVSDSCGSGATQVTMEGITNPRPVTDDATDTLYAMGLVTSGGSYGPCRSPSPPAECIGATYIVCWSHGVTLENNAVNHLVDIGTFAISGPYGDYSVECFIGQICAFSLYGAELGSSNQVRVIESQYSCGDASAGAVKLPGLRNPMRASDVLGTSATFRLGTSGKLRRLRLCWGGSPRVAAHYNVEIGPFRVRETPHGCERGAATARAPAGAPAERAPRLRAMPSAVRPARCPRRPPAALELDEHRHIARTTVALLALVGRWCAGASGRSKSSVRRKVLGEEPRSKSFDVQYLEGSRAQQPEVLQQEVKTLTKDLQRSMVASFEQEVWEECEVPHPLAEQRRREARRREARRREARAEQEVLRRLSEAQGWGSEKISTSAGISTDTEALLEGRAFMEMAHSGRLTLLDVEEIRDVFEKHCPSGRLKLHEDTSAFSGMCQQLYVNATTNEMRHILHILGTVHKKRINRDEGSQKAYGEDANMYTLSDFVIAFGKWLSHQQTTDNLKRCTLTTFKLTAVESFTRDLNAASPDETKRMINELCKEIPERRDFLTINTLQAESLLKLHLSLTGSAGVRSDSDSDSSPERPSHQGSQSTSISPSVRRNMGCFVQLRDMWRRGQSHREEMPEVRSRRRRPRAPRQRAPPRPRATPSPPRSTTTRPGPSRPRGAPQARGATRARRTACRKLARGRTATATACRVGAPPSPSRARPAAASRAEAAWRAREGASTAAAEAPRCSGRLARCGSHGAGVPRGSVAGRACTSRAKPSDKAR